MNWKDWLHIPQSDKIAIACLAILIVITFCILIFLKNRDATKIELSTPRDYAEWQSKLSKKKEEEKDIYLKEETLYYRPYHPKMKEGDTIELNSADTTLLKLIPGVGTGYANRIVNYRTALGGFVQLEQLQEVWGMDTYLYSQVIAYLTLEAGCDSIYINRDSFDKLLKHPYLNYKQVLVIDDIRTRKGGIKSIKRLALLDEFKNKDIERLKSYISFRE